MILVGALTSALAIHKHACAVPRPLQRLVSALPKECVVVERSSIWFDL